MTGRCVTYNPNRHLSGSIDTTLWLVVAEGREVLVRACAGRGELDHPTGIPHVVWDSETGVLGPCEDVQDYVADAPTWPECPEVPTDVQVVVRDHLASPRAWSDDELLVRLSSPSWEDRYRAAREAERRGAWGGCDPRVERRLEVLVAQDPEPDVRNAARSALCPHPRRRRWPAPPPLRCLEGGGDGDEREVRA